MRNFDKRALAVYLVTDRPLCNGRDLVDVVISGVNGGVTMVQLREKECDTAEFIELAMALKSQLSAKGVPLIINDRVDVALACDADGVHIGASDMPYAIARRLLGDDKIIGLSVESMEEVEKANELDVDYIGISPVFSTATKKDIKKPFELEGLSRAASISRHPVVAIGGIKVDNAEDVFLSGADGVAVVSAICSADAPSEAAKSFLDIYKRIKTFKNE